MRWRLSKLNWSYGFGELLIVVTGVLIALAVDQWNSNRLDRLEEDEVLVSLELEFEQNLILIDRELAYRNAVVSSIEKLFAAARGEAPVDPEELDRLINDLTWWGYAEYSTGVVDSVLQGGTLSLVRNSELRRLIAGVLNLYDNAHLHELEDQDSTRNLVYPFLNRIGSLNQIANLGANGRPGVGDVSAEPIYATSEERDHSELLTDAEFLGIVAQQHWDHLDAIYAYDLLSTALETANQMIDAELED